MCAIRICVYKNSEDLKTHIVLNHENETEVKRSENWKSCYQCEFETNADGDLQHHKRRNLHVSLVIFLLRLKLN